MNAYLFVVCIRDVGECVNVAIVHCFYCHLSVRVDITSRYRSLQHRCPPDVLARMTGSLSRVSYCVVKRDITMRMGVVIFINILALM